MNWYINVIAALALIAVGWFYRGEHDAKELQHAIQENQESHARLTETQTRQRAALETELAQTRKVSQQRIGTLMQENSQLRAEAASIVSVEFLIFSRLCDNPEECTLLGFARTDKTTSKTTGTVTAYHLYTVLGALDEMVIAHNLGLEQLQAQLNICRGQ